MKMGSGIFWGVVLIIIGLSLVVKIVFNFDFPVFKILIAFLFIYIGVRIMTGKSWSHWGSHKTGNDVIFGETSFGAPDSSGREYNVIFSKGTYDYRNFQFADSLPVKVKMNTIFGHSLVYLPKDKQVKISADAVFGAAQMPNGNSAAFGNTIYATENFDATKPYLEIEADVVFGHLEIIR